MAIFPEKRVDLSHKANCKCNLCEYFREAYKNIPNIKEKNEKE